MSRPVAGRPPREVMTVDYADVLRQAVLNERDRVLREVRAALHAEPVRKQNRFDSWKYDPVPVEGYRDGVLRRIDRIGDAA